MLTIQELRARIPRLRRHAYLLTGNMHAADAAVETCLKALRRDDKGRRVAADDLDLFRTFHMTLLVPTRPVPGPDAACEADPQLADARDRLFALPPAVRRAVVLVLVEGFSSDEAAAHPARELAPSGTVADGGPSCPGDAAPHAARHDH